MSAPLKAGASDGADGPLENAYKIPVMPFADPTAYSKGQINRAGAEVRSGVQSDEALEIINNWRASHAIF